MAAPSDLERYRPVARLGAGGMSTVELAEDTLLGRRVALKRMHTPDDIGAHSRLRREALIGASLTHPNLVSIFDIITTDDGDDVIVMEYVEGQTLAKLLSQGKPDLPTTMRILAGVSAALDAIHAERIVHRDVKPANILLGADGGVKLADLGIAAMPDRTKITTDGAVLGTFSYMAPEQLEAATATSAVDVYALAAVAYEMLSGRRARNEPNPVALAHAISTQPPSDLRSIWPEAPAAAAEVLVRGMSRDPSQRPRSAGELTRRLQAALEPQTTARIAVPAPPPEPRDAEPAPPAKPHDDASVPAAIAAAGAAAATPATAHQGEPTVVRSAQTAERPSRAPAPRPSRPPRSAPPPPAQTRPRRGAALVLAGLALAAVAAAIIIATSGGSNTASHRPAAKTASHRSAGGSPSQASTSSSSSSNSSGTGASTPAASSGGAPAGSAGSPVSAVETFYHLAAHHQYSAAWALADPTFQNQLGGYSSFQSGQAGDRSITFTSASVTNQSASSATVYVRTTSVRDNGTQHCFGPVSLIRSGSGWMLDHISINCA